MPYYITGLTKRGTVEIDQSTLPPGNTAMGAAIADFRLVTGETETDCWTIPYPASPNIGTYKSGCPSFCLDPRGSCKGRGSCPKSYACSE